MFSTAKKIRIILLGPPLIATLIFSGCFKGTEKKVKVKKEKVEKVEETKKGHKTTKKHDFED